ncbi:MAG: CBS domain-containing protein [Desulfomonile tiedjei]|uniref:CBS domain-containing protein n=1 Tax=Desulfomonile tiedjei TaxID=2358 RepID=A0A9D6V0V4_9BACT|nr:CBS domain-containing protein [Desulfomonile tiedjei]
MRSIPYSEPYFLFLARQRRGAVWVFLCSSQTRKLQIIRTALSVFSGSNCDTIFIIQKVISDNSFQKDPVDPKGTYALGGSVIGRSDNFTVAPTVIIQLLRKTLPFSELDKGVLESVATKCLIDFFPRGTLIFKQDVTDVSYFHLIQKGGVKIYLTSSDTVTTLKDFGGEGETFGALPMVRGHKADLNVETVEDTFCFLLEKDVFLELVREHPGFAQYYLETFSKDLMFSAYAELRCERIRAKSRDSCYLFNYQVRDIIKTRPEVVPSSTMVREAASTMTRLGIGSLLVRDDADGLMGIVTDKDLRMKVVAAGLDHHSPVRQIMTGPVHTIPAQASCFDALLKMMKDQVDHLAVEHRKEIVGIITSHDIMVFQGVSPLYLFREAVSQRSIQGLCEMSRKIPNLVRALAEQGAKAGDITRMVTLLNDKILSGILNLIQKDIGPPPVPFCWLALGSDGRKEQIFRSDQDNALIYEDPKDKWERQAADAYFETLAREAVDNLLASGYPRCKSDIMASNPRWRKPRSVWEKYFNDWISSPEPREFCLALTFFDFRPGPGDKTIGDSLRKQVVSQAERHHIFMVHIAEDCLQNWPPLSFFRNFIVEKDGRHRNRLDLKARGVLPFVNFARLMALRHGISETNTLARLRLLSEEGCLSRQFYLEAREAYEFLTQLVLVRQLEMVECGTVPDGFVDPSDMSDLEKKMLKEVFAVIDRMLSHIKQEFPSLV